MKLNDIIFVDSLPKLDLHGFDRESARVMVNDFIRDNIIMKNEFVTIIHGIGSGIVKNVVLETLKKNKNVIDFKLYPFNVGCTIVQIKIK